MRVLVTGGAGFIGSHVVDRLLAGGHDPVVFDVVRSPYHAEAVEQRIGDVLDLAAVKSALRGGDAVAHLAAMADVNVVAAAPVRASQVNAHGTQVVLEAARQLDVPRFIFGSTVWVYGNRSYPEPVDEDAELGFPSHPYTATKMAAEMYCHAYRELYELDTTTLRFGIPYGPRSRGAAVVAAFVARARAGKALTIAGDGRQRRQFVYVEDLAAGIVAALTSAAGPLYNLVGDESTSILEIAETVRDLVADVPIVHTPERLADVRIGRVSGQRAEREFGWRPAVPFRVGVERYLEWLSEMSGAPISPAASTIEGSAEAVRRQEAGEL